VAIFRLGGKPARKEILVDLARLEREYFERRPDLTERNQMVSFGTSGPRGSPLRGTFTEPHIRAITQAICDYRTGQATDGPLYMGKDTHALSGPAQRTALGEHYRELTAEFGTSRYTRIDAPATPEQRARLQKLSPEAVKESELAGEPIIGKLTRAPGNNAPIGGVKVVAPRGWFAARPSGTEDIYKIYAQSFKDQGHLNAIVGEAKEIVESALDANAPRPRQDGGRP
jgi:phosphoglucomutase